LAGDEFRSGTPVELFRASLTTGGFLERRWSVTPDGERFLLNTPLGDQASLVFTVTTNWAQTLSAK
jgi:hypothetical protein